MNHRRFSLQVPMGTEPSGSGKIKVDEHYPSELDEPPIFDVKKIENIRTNVKFDTLYQVTKPLGDGKFGKVYCVIEKATGKEFAAKFIKIRKEADRAEVEREVSILTQLRHPRIAQIYDAFYTTTNDVVLIMEIVRGGELFDRVAEESYELSELAVVMIICQLCEAIDYIHKQNILHLDVKPENIMCVSLNGNRIKLIDFGLARHYDGTQELKYMAGTPEFAAPEVIKFEKLDYHTDMWSIGVITYILLSGYSPFLGDNLGETYCNVEKGVWEFTEEFDTVSEEAKDFISHLLIYDQSKRMLPHECLQHPWISKHRQKASCNQILEKPLPAVIPLDNKQIMRYNAKRKFRRMIIYVKFLIEMNRLRNSLKTRMSANGHKFFDPLLKMAEKKEQKVTDACTPAVGLSALVQKVVDKKTVSQAPTISEPEKEEKKKKKKIVDGTTKTESLKNKKKVENNEDGLRPPAELMGKRASTGGEHLLAAVKVLKNLEVVENGDVQKEKEKEKKKKSLVSVKEEPVYKTLETTLNGDIRRKSASKLLETAPNGDIRRKSASAKEEVENIPKKEVEGEIVKKKKKSTTSTVVVELDKVASNGDVLEKKKSVKTPVKLEVEKEKEKEKRRSVSLKRGSEVKSSIPEIANSEASEKKKEVKLKAAVTPEVTNLETVAEVKKPARQGALRKRDKSLDDVLNSAPTPTTLSKSSETAVKHSLVETKHTNGDVVKSEKILTKKKSTEIPAVLEEKAKIPKTKTDVVNFESNPVVAVKKPSKIVKLVPEANNALKEEKKPKIVMTSEKQATTTVQTTTSMTKTTKSSEKKVEHTSDGKSVESSQKKNSQKNDLKISQVTTKKEEDSAAPAPKLTVKKNVLKQSAEKSSVEKEQKTTEMKDQEKVVKKTSTIKDKDVAQVSLEHSVKVNDEKPEKAKVTGTKTTVNKVEIKGEEKIGPKKSSLKKTAAKVTGETTNHLEIMKDGKVGSLKTKDTTTVKLSPDSGSDTSSTKNVRIHLTDEQSVKSSVRSNASGVSTRDSSEERKKVRFAGDIESPTKLIATPLFGNGLQKMRSESSLHKRIQETPTVKKSNDDVSLTRKTSMFTDVEFEPREDFSFEALKEKLTRRVSEGFSDKEKRPKQMVAIPPTNSVKDRLRHFEKKFAK